MVSEKDAHVRVALVTDTEWVVTSWADSK